MTRSRKGAIALASCFIGLALVLLTFIDRRGSATGHSVQPEFAATMADAARLPKDRVDATDGDIGRKADRQNNVGAQDVRFPNGAENLTTSQAPEPSVVVAGAQDRSVPYDRSTTERLLEINTYTEPSSEIDAADPPSEDSVLAHDDAGTEEAGVNVPIEVVSAAQREQVERELEEADGYDRDDLLVMYGRSAAATGRFDLAVVAYTMFLEEFGNDHPYSDRIAMRLADSLAPLRFDDIQVTHTSDGPVYHPRWRMDYVPSDEQVEQAIGAYELAALLASEDRLAGEAFLKLGWVYRALGNWQLSTAAWDRCVKECEGTQAAEKAIALAAENLEWTGNPNAAAEMLRSLASDTAEMRIEDLAAQSNRNRTAEWLSNPVASLQDEIAERASQRPAYEVYASAVRWLDRRGEREALIEISRWACTQSAWPMEARIASRVRLVDALLSGTEVSDDDRVEAADALGQLAAIAPDGGGDIPSMRRQSLLLSEVGRFDEAKQVLAQVEDRSVGSLMWEPVVLGDRIRLLLNQGDREAAREVFEELSESYPESSVTDQYESVLAGQAKEGTN